MVVGRLDHATLHTEPEPSSAALKQEVDSSSLVQNVSAFVFRKPRLWKGRSSLSFRGLVTSETTLYSDPHLLNVCCQDLLGKESWSISRRLCSEYLIL